MKQVFSEFRNHALLASVLLMAVLFPMQYKLSIAVLAIAFYWLRTKSRSVVVFIMVLVLALIPRRMKMPGREGIVVSRSARYVTVLSEGAEGIVYFQSEPPVLDSVVRLDGQWEEITYSKGFFRFDFAKYCRRQNRHYSMSCVPVEVKPSHSLRGLLQKHIAGMENAEKRVLLDRLIFGIRNEEVPLSSSLQDSGFSLAGVLMFLNWLLKYFLNKEDLEKVMLVITGVMALFFHFPYLLVQRLIFALLKRNKELTYRQCCGIGWIIGLVLYPHVITSASFLLPSVYRFTSLFGERKKIISAFWAGIMQSLLFHQWSPLMTSVYPFLVSVQGCLFLFALLSCFVPLPLTAVSVLDRIVSLLDLFVFPGTILGFGAVFFILLCFLSRKNPRKYVIWLAWFALFQCSGLFHPFAELTFINVGQGDAILLRAPLGMDNVLIDTGKESQYRNLKTMLDAKGIRHLDTFFVTHADSDHSGNRDAVIKEYSPDQVIEEHQERTDSRKLSFFDLNEISSEDENASSLVLYTMIGDTKILLTGDCDAAGEKQIVRKYGDLDVDVLKLSHHGSHTGSCEEFLNAARPEVAVVSSGAYRIYHHPNPEVVQRLLARHIPYVDTKEEGDITFLFLGKFCIMITSAGHIAMV